MSDRHYGWNPGTAPAAEDPAGTDTLRTLLYQMRLLLDAEIARVNRSLDLVARLEGGPLFALSAERSAAVDHLSGLTLRVQQALARARRSGAAVDEHALSAVRADTAHLLEANRVLTGRLTTAHGLLDAHLRVRGSRNTYNRSGGRRGGVPVSSRTRTA
jgi:hypothetical protein